MPQASRLVRVGCGRDGAMPLLHSAAAHSTPAPSPPCPPLDANYRRSGLWCSNSQGCVAARDSSRSLDVGSGAGTAVPPVRLLTLARQRSTIVETNNQPAPGIVLATAGWLVIQDRHAGRGVAARPSSAVHVACHGKDLRSGVRREDQPACGNTISSPQLAVA